MNEQEIVSQATRNVIAQQAVQLKLLEDRCVFLEHRVRELEDEKAKSNGTKVKR